MVLGVKASKDDEVKLIFVLMILFGIVKSGSYPVSALSFQATFMGLKAVAAGVGSKLFTLAKLKEAAFVLKVGAGCCLGW